MIRHINPIDSSDKTDSICLAYRNEPDFGEYTHCLLQVYCGTTDVDIGVYLTPDEVIELKSYLEEYLNMMSGRPVVFRFQNNKINDEEE